MTTRSYDYAVWGTQGGGIAREFNGGYIFVEKPDCAGLDVGDEVPEEWAMIPANDLAKRSSNQDQGIFEADVETFFDLAFTAAQKGEMSFDEVARFFPEHRQRESRTTT